MDEMERYAAGQGLQEELEANFGSQPHGLAIRYWLNGREHGAAIKGFDAGHRVPVGCLAKSLSCTLLSFAVHEGRLGLEDAVAPLLAVFNPRAAQAFRSMRVHHLLNHVHGLDSCYFDGSLPRRANGFIDEQALVAGLPHEAFLAPAGRLLHIGNAGPWLCALMLELLYQRPYAELLDRNLMRPLGLSAAGSIRPDLCPSLGFGLCLSAEDLWRFAMLHLDGLAERPGLPGLFVEQRRRYRVPLFAWPPLGKALCPGWIDFGGSFGQLGYADEGSVALRMVPARRLVISITSRHPRLASAAMATMFQPWLDPPPPRATQPALDEQAKDEAASCSGWYRNARFCLHLDQVGDAVLRLRVYRRGIDPSQGSAPYIKRHLARVAPDTWLPTQAEAKVCPLLRFREPEPGIGYQYLETQSQVFSRYDPEEAPRRNPEAGKVLAPL